jgi:hypothetical protein
MELNLEVISDQPVPVVEERINAYLSGVGYKQSQPGVYTRGSLLSTWTSFSLRGWQAQVTTRVTPTADRTTQAVSAFKINATGQLVTRKELQFWEVERGGLEVAIQSGVVDAVRSQHAARQATTWGLSTFAVAIGIALLVAVFLFALSTVYMQLTGTKQIPLSSTAMTTIALIAGLAYAVSRDRRQRG